MEVNFFGTVALTKAFLELVRESKGRVINVSSLAGLWSRGSGSVYSASKFALEAFTDSLRREMRAVGVAVSSVNPGFVVTKIYDKAIERLETAPTYEQKWLDVYSRYLVNTKESVHAAFAKGDSTEVTTDAIVHASFSPRPKTRYYVANVKGLPAPVAAILAYILPSYVADKILEP